MKTDILQTMQARAKNRVDGVYSHVGYKYYVQNNRVLLFIEHRAVYQVVGNFVTQVSKTFDYKFQAEKYLKEQVKK